MAGFLLSADGKNFERIGEVSEVDLTVEEENTPEYMSKAAEFTAKGDTDGLFRAILGQSAYNSMKLRQDGYLSPKNGWIQ